MNRSKYNLVAWILLGFMCHSCKSVRTGSAKEKNIFGSDDRIPMRSKQYPWSAIGRLDFFKARDDTGFSAFGHCTAFLIGRSTILTNAHCVVDRDTGKANTDHKLRLNLQDSEPLGTFDAVVLQIGSAKILSMDWAIMSVSGAPGETFGWFEIASNQFMQTWAEQHQTPGLVSDFSKRVIPNLILAGYSGDFQNGSVAGVQTSCALRGTSPGGANLMHDCDMTKGASGSPIFAWNLSLAGQGAQLFALNNAQKSLSDASQVTTEFSVKTANLAVRLEKFSREVVAARVAEENLNRRPALKDVIARLSASESP